MVDAASRDKFHLSSSHGDLDYAHVVDEALNEIFKDFPDDEQLDEGACLSKGEVKNYEIDLSSFEPQKRLHPKVWPNDHINSRVRLRLLDIADDFIDTMNVGWAKPKDIILTGSLANYNWSKYSDFDLHILYDFNDVDKRTDFVKDYFDSKKSLWNEKHENLKIYGFPVELYVQNANEEHTSSGVYSLNKNEWIEKPEKSNIKSIKKSAGTIKAKSIDFMKQIDKLNDECNTEKSDYDLEKTSGKVKALFDKIKNLRKKALNSGGEMSIGNIVFKVLRRTKYIEKLANLKGKFYDRINSLINESATSKQPTAYLMVGIPGSGKSTWVKNNLPKGVSVVSRDIIRGELGMSSGADEKVVGTKEQENAVTKAEYNKIRTLSKQGLDFVIDDTNTGRYRKQMVDFLRSCGVRVVFVRLNTDLETCIKRRTGQIPPDVMKRIHSNLVEPTEGEYDEIINV